ncbi:hypothetical protein CP532_6671 [Ophiocordyceps camponoti-leonardi (nom. inval.)]|nr:hypothetical protein CP532_6671 [Ophiocordyceps camponoti-leonardi (nom. inval.)]
MAVIPEFDGLSVKVEIQGQTATEYPVPEDFEHQPSETASAKKPICCFIESVSGLSFSVEAYTTRAFKAPHPFDHFILHVWVDGNYVRGLVQPLSGGPVKLKIDSCEQPSAIPGCIESRRLMFSAVSGVDDATQSTIDRDIKVASQMGTIKAQEDNDVKSKKIKLCDEPETIDLTGFASRPSVKMEKKPKLKRNPVTIDLTSD